MKIFYISLLIFIPSLIWADNNKIIHVKISPDETAVFIFNKEIIHNDIGAPEGIASQIVPGIPQILKLKIDESFQNIHHTNMLVITSNNLVFSFHITFDKKSCQYIYPIADSSAVNYQNNYSFQINKPLSTPDTISNKEIYNRIISKKEYLPRILVDRKGKVTFAVLNIYTIKDKLYFLCEMKNHSMLLYHIDFCNMFTTTSSKKIKAIATQDIEHKINYLPQLPTAVQAKNSLKFILVTDKFTLENNSEGIIEIYERVGGRHLKVRFDNTALLGASILSD